VCVSLCFVVNAVHNNAPIYNCYCTLQHLFLFCACGSNSTSGERKGNGPDRQSTELRPTHLEEAADTDVDADDDADDDDAEAEDGAMDVLEIAVMDDEENTKLIAGDLDCDEVLS